MFTKGKIKDLVFCVINKNVDERGYLAEMHRIDELQKNLQPVMSYISVTHAGVSRGPHEHKKQSDIMIFVGASKFKIYLWDMRKKSESYKVSQILFANEGELSKLIVPNGVVHAYKNVGKKDGIVINMPNQLYKGKNKKYKVDEIRHENELNTIYKIK
ncbi:MAG: dTDP-4-dehydrorhamnose 3,5-epimerase family protein [Bacteroidota bacterium]